MDIDFVVLWVDGNDPKWLQEKNKYSPQKVDDSNSANRYREWGTLKYWFRAVEKYAPWVRRIHFVTWGHLPEFLDTNNPKIHVVNHRDFIPEKWLPTFSANPIEMNIHRIDGLAEHFVYFNDDMFLGHELKPDYFFVDGIPTSYFAELPLAFIGKTEVWQMLAANDLGIINKHFNKRTVETSNIRKYYNVNYGVRDNIRSLLLGLLNPNHFIGFKNFHAPAPYLKSTFETLWREEPKLLEDTSFHKFRNREDVNQWLALWWQVASGTFVPHKMKCGTFSISENSMERISKAIQSESFDMYCLNDPSGEYDFEALSNRLILYFDTAFPQKSSFEK